MRLLLKLRIGYIQNMQFKKIVLKVCSIDIRSISGNRALIYREGKIKVIVLVRALQTRRCSASMAKLWCRCCIWGSLICCPSGQSSNQRKDATELCLGQSGEGFATFENVMVFHLQKFNSTNTTTLVTLDSVKLTTVSICPISFKWYL